MTKRQRKRLERYVRHLADELGLRDWTFVIGHRTADADKCAQIAVADEAKVARILFSADFWDHSPAERRDTVIHELLHCHTTPLTSVFEDLAEVVGRTVAHPTSRVVYRQIEWIINAIAGSIAPRFETMETLEKRAKKAKTAP